MSTCGLRTLHFNIRLLRDWLDHLRAREVPLTLVFIIGCLSNTYCRLPKKTKRQPRGIHESIASRALLSRRSLRGSWGHAVYDNS